MPTFKQLEESLQEAIAIKEGRQQASSVTQFEVDNDANKESSQQADNPDQ